MMFNLKLSHSGEKGLILEPLLLVLPCSWILLCKRAPHSGVVQAGRTGPLGSLSGMVGSCPWSAPCLSQHRQSGRHSLGPKGKREAAGSCKSAVLHTFLPGPEDFIVHHIASGFVPPEWVSNTPPSLPPGMSQWRLFFFLVWFTAEGQRLEKGNMEH